MSYFNLQALRDLLLLVGQDVPAHELKRRASRTPQELVDAERWAHLERLGASNGNILRRERPAWLEGFEAR